MLLDGAVAPGLHVLLEYLYTVNVINNTVIKLCKTLKNHNSVKDDIQENTELKVSSSNRKYKPIQQA